MEVKYDIPQYIASVKMSRKNRVLVEGKDDKSHVKNLLFTILGKNKIKVDTAEAIKGDCGVTAKNNKAKLDKIHKYCSGDEGYDNLYFLCDREFGKFDIDDKIVDLMSSHENDGNLYWTLGHSFENYFIENGLVSEAYRYLTGSEFKDEAIRLFKGVLPEALKIVAAISLAAKEIDKSTYPIGVIHWSDFEINNGFLNFPTGSWCQHNASEIKSKFINSYNKYIPIVRSSEDLVCARICRGHTAMKIVQRVFSYCLYKAGEESNKELAIKHAEEFSKLKESSLSSALCEAWLRSINEGNENYPVNLISSVA